LRTIGKRKAGGRGTRARKSEGLKLGNGDIVAVQSRRMLAARQEVQERISTDTVDCNYPMPGFESLKSVIPGFPATTIPDLLPASCVHAASGRDVRL
jgi:hypothetical protein